MSTPERNSKRRRARQGSALVEFAVAALTLLIVVFGSIEIDRMAVTYTALAQAAKTGARYAITHGIDRTGSGMDASALSAGTTGGCLNSPNNVQTVVRNFASAGILNSANVNVTACYSAGDDLSGQGVGGAGSNVRVQVTYAYDPFFNLLPLGVTLSSTSQGTVTF